MNKLKENKIYLPMTFSTAWQRYLKAAERSKTVRAKRPAQQRKGNIMEE
jgi:hypothetical protein